MREFIEGESVRGHCDVSPVSMSVQGDPKKMSLSVFKLKSVLDVAFDFSACVLESEF